MNRILLCVCTLFTILDTFGQEIGRQIIFSGPPDNDLYMALEEEGYSMVRFDHSSEAIEAASEGDAVFIISEGYPKTRTELDSNFFKKSKMKSLRLYVEYPSFLPGMEFPDKPIQTRLERGVITSKIFGPQLEPMSILGINDCHILPVKMNNSLMVLAKIAGFDKAVYGIDDVDSYPLLFEWGNMVVSTTQLSNFVFGQSTLSSGPRSEQDSAAYGLIGWSHTHPGVYYGDDNARAILGILGASAFMETDTWDKEVLQAILGNFRTTGRKGFSRNITVYVRNTG